MLREREREIYRHSELFIHGARLSKEEIDNPKVGMLKFFTRWGLGIRLGNNVKSPEKWK